MTDVTRRDFVKGAGSAAGTALLASTAASAVAKSTTEAGPDTVAGPRTIAAPGTVAVPGTVAASDMSAGVAVDYPPMLQGLRGQTDLALSVAHAMRDGRSFPDGEDRGEVFDLVVVGGGASGLAAAYYFRKALPESKVLVLDNSDDFGGHARRNEFQVDSQRLIASGGAYAIMFPETYTPEGTALLADIGVVADRYYAATADDEKIYSTLGLTTAVFFNKESFGVDRLVDRYPEFMPMIGSAAAPGWRQFLARAPLSPRTKSDLLRLTGASRDYLPELTPELKIQRLRQISYTDFLERCAGVGAETLLFLQNQVGSAKLNVGAGPDSLSAWMAYKAGCPGFQGMGLPRVRVSSIVADDQIRPDIHFPDGNAGVLRLLVRWLIPGALPGTTMEDSVLRRVDYSMLDCSGNAVRIRLNSTVVRVRHEGEPNDSGAVFVDYVRDGLTSRVRAKTCVMACFNTLVPYLCPELPAGQREDLKLAVRKPLVIATAALRNWRAFAQLRVDAIYSPGSFYHAMALDVGTKLGGNWTSSRPEDPATVFMTIQPNVPGLPAREQYRAARGQLLGIDLATYEGNLRSQLQRMLGPGGFDSSKDISGITINRWAHGYACGGNDLYDPPITAAEPRWVRARKRFGRIAIANSDAAGVSLMQAAFDQGNRAVRELITDVIRPEFFSCNPEQG